MTTEYIKDTRTFEDTFKVCTKERDASAPYYGGVVAFFNPEPLADFFDFCFVGEAKKCSGSL